MITARAGAAARAVVVLGVVGLASACGSPAAPPADQAPDVAEVAERPSALADPARWDAPAPLAAGGGALQAADLDEVLPGRSEADRWRVALVDVQPAWLRRACERMPVGEDGEPIAAAGPRPSSQSTQAWVRGQDSAGFTTTEVLRWSGDGDGDGGVAAAGAWAAEVVAEASRCPGAVVVDPFDGTGDTAVVVLAEGDGRSSTAYALAAAGSTAFEVGTRAVVGGSAQETGAAAAALLERTAARQLAADDAVRLSGVDDDALAPFSDSAAHEVVPPLHTVGPPPEVPLDTSDDVAAAFPGTGAWEGLAQAAIGGGWERSWCDPDGWLPVELDQPTDAGGLWAPEGSSWPDDPPSVVVDVDVLRWPLAVGGPPQPLAGYDWAEAVRTDAADCPGARPAAAVALPGAASSAALVADDDGGWRVQVATAGGPTAVRVRVHLAPGASESEACAAATSAAALARRVVANTVRADAAALERS